MPVVDHNTINGPTEQASGEWRGDVEYIFGDGRKVQKRIVAPSLPEWTNKKSDLVPEVEAKMEEDDAAEGVSADDEVIAKGEASIEQRAVAYLRAAWQEENARDAYLLFDKFNDFRNKKGWNLNQVEAGLMSAGLSAEEWADMKKAYQFLNGGGRPATMNDAKAIQDMWETR